MTQQDEEFSPKLIHCAKKRMTVNRKGEKKPNQIKPNRSDPTQTKPNKNEAKCDAIKQSESLSCTTVTVRVWALLAF